MKLITFSYFCHTLFSSLFILCPHQIQLTSFNPTCQSTLHHADSTTSWICSCMLALSLLLPSHSVFFAQKLSPLVTFLSISQCESVLSALFSSFCSPITQSPTILFLSSLYFAFAFFFHFSFTYNACTSLLSPCFTLTVYSHYFLLLSHLLTFN